MTMCTVKEIQEAIREDCKSQHDMDSTDIDRVMQTLPFAQEEPFTEQSSFTKCKPVVKSQGAAFHDAVFTGGLELYNPRTCENL